jgi:hypothetical protein
LRPCTFSKKVRVDGVWPDNIKEIKIKGLFHRWSQESDPDGGVSTVAVVECMDGSVEIVHAESIVFDADSKIKNKKWEHPAVDAARKHWSKKMNKKEELRKCVFEKRIHIQGRTGSDSFETVDINGRFHRWSQESEPSGEVSTVAVVECMDGSIELVYAESVRFLD